MPPWTPHCAQSVWGRLWEKGMACSICRKACLHKNAKMPWKATCLDGPGKTKCCYLGVWDDADGLTGARTLTSPSELLLRTQLGVPCKVGGALPMCN